MSDKREKGWKQEFAQKKPDIMKLLITVPFDKTFPVPCSLKEQSPSDFSMLLLFMSVKILHFLWNAEFHVLSTPYLLWGCPLKETFKLELVFWNINFHPCIFHLFWESHDYQEMPGKQKWEKQNLWMKDLIHFI